MRRQELPGPVQRRDRFVEDRVISLEDVGHPGGDVEVDLDVGGGGLAREADGVGESAAGGLAGEDDVRRCCAVQQEGFVGGQGVVDRGRIRVFGGCADNNSRS
jgi:hypothetical protein